MKRFLSWILAAPLLMGSSSCIFVHVRGDLHDELLDGDEGFPGLLPRLDACLVDPVHELDISGTAWNLEATWTISFAEGSDGGKAFHEARSAVLERIAREGGRVVEETSTGPHAWECEFEQDGERGEASVTLVEQADPGAHRPHELEVTWEQAD